MPDTINKEQLLFGINQGCTYDDLRVWHMQEIAKLDCDGYAIGGLAVGRAGRGYVPHYQRRRAVYAGG